MAISQQICSVELSTGEIEYLVTNILDPNITPEMLKKLYHKRWKIESKYYELKEHWELEQFNGATSRSIENEFFIYSKAILNRSPIILSRTFKQKRLHLSFFLVNHLCYIIL